MAVITISVPDDVLEAINAGADTAGMNRSEFIVDAVTMRLKLMRKADLQSFAAELAGVVLRRAVAMVAEAAERGETVSDDWLVDSLAVEAPASLEWVDGEDPHAAGGDEGSIVVAKRRRPFKRAKIVNG